MLLFFAAAFIFIIWIYILFLREWLVSTFPGGRVQWWHEEIEDKLWDKSRTILVGRAYQLGGIIIALNAFAVQAGLDVNSILSEIVDLLPTDPKYRSLILTLLTALWVWLTGMAINWLRKRTDTSLSEKASSLDQK